MQNSSPATVLLGALTDCSVLLRHQVTAVPGGTSPNAFLQYNEAWGFPKEIGLLLLSFPCCWHPCPSYEQKTEHFQRGKKQDRIYTLTNPSPVRFCPCTLFVSLCYIFQQNELSYYQPMKTQEGRSLTDRWQHLPPYFVVGWNEFLLTSFLAQFLLACQIKTCMHNHCWNRLLMDLLSQDHCISAFRSLTWVLARLRGETTEPNNLERLLKSFAPVTAGH